MRRRSNESGCGLYLLASAIESSTALLRDCDSCGMLKPLLGYPSILFIASVVGLGSGRRFSDCVEKKLDRG